MAMNKATRVTVQTLPEVQNQRSEDQRGHKLGSPVLKQPQFNWEATDKYMEWKAFRLESKKCPFHVQCPRTRQDCHGKELAEQEGSTLPRKLDRDRKTCMQHITGGSHLSWIFWEHENQSGLLVIWLIYIKLYRKKETKFWKKNPG